MDKPYVPISCEIHDQMLELATFRRECLLTIRSDNGDAMQLRGIITDVFSRDRAEYLRLQDGTVHRLDQVEAMDGRTFVW